MNDFDISRPLLLLPQFKHRVWGWNDVTPWFRDAPPGVIGEAWFTAPDNLLRDGMEFRELLRSHPRLLGDARNPDYPEFCPLLVKFLFTSDRLSVQVHPKDEYAREHHGCLGKTEAWYVIEAQADAAVALGLKQQLSPEQFRAAAESGEIEDQLDWRPVRAGDLVYVPAGTVHAIGPGLTICEIQQNSDITYRLYDYGRPRELHLDRGCDVADLRPYAQRTARQRIAPGREILVRCDCFTVEHWTPSGDGLELAGGLPHYVLLIPLSGTGTIGGAPFSKGQTWFVPAAVGAVAIHGDGEWLAAYAGDQGPVPVHSL
jgi:mannose-6-phosphate isomerase